jgi:membrane dipeptidase
MSINGQQFNRRRLLTSALAAGVVAIGPSLINRGRFRVFAANPQTYSVRAIKIVERSLVIDMLAPLRMDLEPKAYAEPLTDLEVEMFRDCGITGFHNSIGLGGPTAHEDALEFLAAWQGLAGRNADVFSLVGKASDLDHAKHHQKIAVMMGINSARRRT